MGEKIHLYPMFMQSSTSCPMIQANTAAQQEFSRSFLYSTTQSEYPKCIIKAALARQEEEG
jgi:hypothetical protein